MLNSHISKGILYNFDELIATERLNVMYLRTLLSGDGLAPLDFESKMVLGSANNESRRVISNAVFSFFVSISQRIPTEIKAEKIDKQELEFLLADFEALGDCIHEEDDTNDKGFHKIYVD